MPTIPIHLSPTRPINPPPNPLPQLLQTPTGLAILEIQGTINLPPPLPSESATPVGRLVFPYYDPNDITESKSWMKTVHLYIGQYQRLTGEVKKLNNPVAVLRKRDSNAGIDDEMTEGHGSSEELEIVEIVYWKVLFSSRPEPVGSE